ncbi:olfactory receptor 5P64-like [Leptodactylus fuscus]|uniref:olfactory receptor 5P64-like n=1 Tax=Leptodactylus fuscus TaxID=238119 RepID=UPI003F4E8145
MPQTTTLINNVTSVILLGLTDFRGFRIPFSSLLALIYGATVSGNLLIILLFLLSNSLRAPMYFFITQLSIFDLLLTSDIVPVLLHSVLYGGSTMTLIGCIVQFSFFVISDSSECLLLSVMSYDRYVAICNPLRYHSIMSYGFCVTSVSVIWVMGFMVMLMYVLSINSLHFCGPHIIDHFYCDFQPIMQLSCSDTTIIYVEILIIGVINGFCPFIVIVMSYVYIVLTILKIPSNTGRHKAFSTCSSHLTVVSMLYGTLLIVYMFPIRENSPTLSKVLSLSYTVVTPLLNPVIYTLRNKDVKEAVRRIKLVSLIGKDF